MAKKKKRDISKRRAKAREKIKRASVKTTKRLGLHLKPPLLATMFNVKLPY